MDKHNIRTLNDILPLAERDGYAVGAFSPRCIPLIRPILFAAQITRSPIIVQISQKELDRYQVSLVEFAKAFFTEISDLDVTVPVALHLDHTWQTSIIEKAIEVGFSSVMIDASGEPLEENIKITKDVVAFAHQQGVSVEGELGRIKSVDSTETISDEALFTKPEEAEVFVRETGVDALAVSVGTFHGVYPVQVPKIDLERLRQIREFTSAHLVLHGGSGVPAEQVRAAIHLPGGGISKVNIATDLELAVIKSLDRKTRLTSSEMSVLPEALLCRVQEAVESVVMNRIKNFLGSDHCG